ncbi:NucA/NucB deoxyribonuclease domain-containing protein [Nonomuraea phyllanthi]|uniref:NucA/NucB deoxyribonuclease domain-containing protein n=1 Tax=Nonomuraea phyllanthi TaxID=2219224 RepID=UPI001884CAEF|nr:hypothetical protein [Nonomuraea phyllanthi]
MFRIVLAAIASSIILAGLPATAAQALPPDADEIAQRIRQGNASIRQDTSAGKKASSKRKVRYLQSCDELRKQRKNSSTRSKKKVACSTGPKMRTAAANPEGGVPPGVPDWCKDAGLGWYAATRFNQCTWRTEGIEWWAGDFVVGGIDFTLYNDIVTVWNEGAFIFGDHVWAYNEWGEWEPDMLLASVAVCSANCTIIAAPPNKDLQLRTWIQFNTVMRSTVAANAVETLDPASGLIWDGPASDDDVEYVTEGPSDLRCDNGLLKGTDNEGCVMANAWPTLTYKGSEWDEIAPHISRSQAAGSPGTPGVEPLHRMYDDADAAQNRRDACSFITGSRPPNSDCDEYPMAHTYEGAYTCGCDDFTVEWVDSSQNQLAGQRYGDFGREQRLLDNDPFFVYADLSS